MPITSLKSTLRTFKRNKGALAHQTTVLKNELLKSGIATAACNFSQSLTNIYYSGWDVDWPGKNARQKVLFDFYGTGYDFSRTTATGRTGNAHRLSYCLDRHAPMAAELRVPCAATVVDLRSRRYAHRYNRAIHRQHPVLQGCSLQPGQKFKDGITSHPSPPAAKFRGPRHIPQPKIGPQCVYF